MRPTLRYVCSLIAGAAISLALLLTAADLTAPAAAVPPDDPFAWTATPGPVADATPERYDDGVVIASGAALDPPPPKVATGTARPIVVRTVYYRRTAGWWTRGPVRRVVSWPVRCLIGRRCR